ncbi:MAG: hypoxanthine phosphoribosyltransferase [Bdellovibrionales bacterium]|nr:hypoxanthine phosphoribosyltransferase [Bdellovibrionales bacterium]
MGPLKLTPYLKENQIRQKVQAMGAAITDQFRNKDLLAVCVLKGSFMFYSDLIRELDLDLSCEFCGLSSYQNEVKSSGEVRITLDLNSPIKNRHVLLIEDIVDTGITMNFLRTHLMSRKPASLTTATLLLKPHALKVKCELDHVGFEIPNDFVVGYGLDYQGYYRNLPYIAQIQSLN